MRGDLTASPVLLHRAPGACPLAAAGRAAAMVTGAGLGLGRALSVELSRRGLHAAASGATLIRPVAVYSRQKIAPIR